MIMPPDTRRITNTKMSNMPLAIEILRHYPDVDASDITCLGNAGGFSGAWLWKITTPPGPLCLRK